MGDLGDLGWPPPLLECLLSLALWPVASLVFAAVGPVVPPRLNPLIADAK